MARKLRAQWRKSEDDIVYFWPEGKPKRDARLICNMLEGCAGSVNIVDELKERGYDITTLRFSIQVKETECSK